MSQYATVAEFALYGLPATATSELAPADIDALLQSASAFVDGEIVARGYETPLTVWDKDLTSAVCKLAAYDVIFHVRGANPADPAHAAIVASWEWAQKVIRTVADGRKRFANTTPARNTQATAGTFSLLSDDGTSDRGW